MVHATIAESNRLSCEIAAATERWLKLGNKIEVVPITINEDNKKRFNETVNPKHESMMIASGDFKRLPKKRGISNSEKNFLMGRFFYELRKTRSTRDVGSTLVELSDQKAFCEQFSGATSVILRRYDIYKNWRESQGLPVYRPKINHEQKIKERREAKQNEVAELFDSGLSYDQIAERLEVSARDVQIKHNAYKRRNGIKTLSQSEKAQKREQELLSYLESGMSVDEIGDIMRLKSAGVRSLHRRALKRLNANIHKTEQ